MNQMHATRIGRPARFLLIFGSLALALSTTRAQSPSSSTQAPAQSPRLPVAPPATIVVDEVTRIADPKLAGGGVELSFHLEPVAATLAVKVEVLHAGSVIATPWSGVSSGSSVPTDVSWNGRDTGGQWCDTGSYTVRLSGSGMIPVTRPLNIVRLGITEIEAQDSAVGDDEWQMVYFRKGNSYAFYATPAIHEYLNTGDAFATSDLDQNNGDPRPTVLVHGDTDSPVLDGSAYETERYNYPLAYLRGSSPRFELTFGDGGTSSSWAAMPSGYPIAGRDIRVVASMNDVSFFSEPIVPGGTTIIDLPALPDEVQRIGTRVDYSWQERASGTTNWNDIPGKTSIPARFYTLLGEPNFRPGVTGTQYSGPWVEVADYVSIWAETLQIAATDEFSITESFVKGFFGQNGGLPAPLEGIIYDAGPLGGDGGATHYFMFTGWNMRLSRLLNSHASGVFVNCSDNMGATTTMLAMMGVDGMRPVRLGEMNLKAIWGIGAPAYTTNLWGGGHGFSYHHIVTNDGAVTVSDTCLQLDEDGNPGSTPGIPGWNHHRPWDGADGYNFLSSYNNTTKNVQTLPGLQ